jgi:NitT/TauT family transport system ATP-binding protein
LEATSTAQAAKGVEIRLSHVRHAFPSGDAAVRVLWDLDLVVPAGQFVALIGPSGCGKTTMLAMLGGLVRPSFGKVSLDGTVVTVPPREAAYMLARDALLPWRTAIQNVELGLQVRGMPRAERRKIALDWLERVGLSEFAEYNIVRMSQGMRQRVAIARTLALNPRCILMDEPFAALDAQTRTILQQEFLRLWERERPTVLLVTHDVSEAVLLSDRAILMSKRPGRVLMDLDINLPRPRAKVAPMEDPIFRSYCRDLEFKLRDEIESLHVGGQSGA